MKLNKCAIKEFEDCSPPLKNAITIPVEGTNVVIYVGGTAFGERVTQQQVSEVVAALTLSKPKKSRK